MSIFERRLIRKVYLDDSYSLKATIIGTETTQGHTEYVIKVKRELQPENCWIVHRRYNDFLSLHHLLQVSGINLPLPPKKIIGNMNRNFIAERQDALQNYLDIVLSHSLLSSQLAFKKFLDPQNYTPFRELGITGVTIGLRGETDIKIIKQLPHMGSRLRKEYYLVKLKSCPKQELILTWLPFGPDSPHDQKQIFSLLKVLTSLQHINIASLVKAGVCNDGAWVIREIRETGSILDKICGVSKSPWLEHALKKYGSYKARKAIESEKIVGIVTQILQALAFLHHKSIPYGHLHNGNIVYDEGTVKLLDIENGLLGVPCIYRSFLTKVKHLTSFQSVDVYCLGLAIYEMATASPFSPQNQNFSNLPDQLRPVIESILSSNVSRTGLPTVADLLNIDLFRQVSANPLPHINLTTSAKQLFGACESKTLQRLKEDYSRYRQEKRVLKACESLDETEGHLLVCYKKRTKHVERDVEFDGNDSFESCQSSINSHSNMALSSSSVDQFTVPFPVLAEPDDGRQALLGAICNFNKGNLKKINKTIS